MDLHQLQEKFPGYHIEDRSKAIDELPGWVWMSTLVLAGIPLASYFLFVPDSNFNLHWIWLAWTFFLLLLHEGTHAIAWKLASGLPWPSFKFGVQWKTVTPYCHSISPMSADAYRIGAFAPLIVTGIVPWIIGLILNDPNLVIAGAILISGAAGDLYILWSIRGLPNEVLLQDHDEKAGCVSLWPVDSLNQP